MILGIKEEVIFIYFQQCKYGGGDVLLVSFIEDGDKVVIIFEEVESEQMNICVDCIKVY